MHKIFILRFSDSLAYLEEFRYNTHDERYEATKDIRPEHIFEESELLDAYEKIAWFNN